jgi:hypothetical protein
MAKYYKVSITGENYAGLFDVKYSLTSSQSTYTFANIAGTSPVTQSISMSYADMTDNGGLEVEVPDGVYKLKIEDQEGYCSDVTSSILGEASGAVSGSGTTTYYLSTGFSDEGDNCGSIYIVNNEVSSDASSIALGLNSIVYEDGSIFKGYNLYYIVNTQAMINPGTGSAGSFYYWQINNLGEVEDVVQYNCGSGGGSL